MNSPQPVASSSTTKLDLWSDILKSADRQNALGRKNLLVLSERHHGRKQIIERMVNSTSGSKRRKKEIKTGRGGLALGYEVMEIRDEGDEESAPPLSVYYPPSSQKSFAKLIPTVLPPKSISDTAVMILLDWTKPSSMIKELLHWLSWVEEWAGSSKERGQVEEMREKLQSHIQHYVEPAAPANSSTSPASTPALPSISSVYGSGPLLPLGQGTLTLNSAGLPIIVVCTKADLMDNVGDEIGMKGAGWEERTDWIQQVLRTVCLSYGASLFYTAPTQPKTYTVLVQYLLHRLYTTPPPLNPPTDAPPPPTSTRFPFSYRANVLDRDAVLVPVGWDSWGKINVLRDGFDTSRVHRAWETSVSRMEEGDEGDEREGIEDLWEAMIPNTEKGPRAKNLNAITTTSEPEQAFLSRQLDLLQKGPNRDPRQSFRNALPTSTSSATGNTVTADGGGVVGPMGSTGLGLNLPGVEKAMLEMEGSGLTGEDLKEKFARLGRREGTKAGPLSPTGAAPSGAPSTPGVPNEALHNFFQGLLANKGKSATKDKPSTPPPTTTS